MSDTATLTIDGQTIDLPIVVGTENEKAIDISALRKATGYITLDYGFVNTGSTESVITYIDGEKGILRHMGYPLEQLSEHSSFVEVCYLLIYGDLIQDLPELTIPHPELRNRRFYLEPLAEIAPALLVPPDRSPVSEVLARLGAEQEVTRLKSPS